MATGKNQTKKGRKALYADWITEDGLSIIRMYESLGWTDEKIAREIIGITPQTLCEWKNRFPELAEAIKGGRQRPLSKVVEALQFNCLGGKVRLKKVVMKKTVEYDNGKRVREVTEPIEVEEEIYVKPDTTAQIFYLKNRDSNNWRDKVQQEITGADGGAIQVQTMNDEDIDKRIAELEAKLKQ